MKGIRAIELLAGFVLAMLVVNYLTKQQQNFDEFALGEGTSVHFAKVDSYPIHFDRFIEQTLNGLRKGWEVRGKKNVILVLGNSQTHGINQFEQGQKPYNHLLFDQLKDSFDVLTVSIPNISFQDMYLVYNYFIENYPIVQVVIPTFMDDMREDGLKSYAIRELAQSGYRINDTSYVADFINKNLDDAITEQQTLGVEGNDLTALTSTDQERAELVLNEELNERLTSWKNRPTLRGKIYTTLYRTRNSIFNISATSKRKMISARYSKNMNVLKDIIKSCRQNAIDVLLYIPPIRNDVETPYVHEEYETFKKQISQLAIDTVDSTVEYYNFENIVPPEYWGYKSATNLSGDKELDFMHFQYEGHVKLYNEFKRVIK